MKHSRLRPVDAALIASGTPSFADLVRQLDGDPELSEGRRRDMISGLRRVARAIERTPEDIPADPRWLQHRLGKVEPAALGVTPKSWSNAVSDARAAMARCGIVKRRIRRKADLSEAWRRLWDLVLASGDSSLQPALRRFVHFLDAQGVAPLDVTDADTLAYREALVASEISKSPEVAWRAAVNGWNLARRRLPDWPQVVLTLPSRQKRVRLAEEAYEDTFLADLDRLALALATPDPLAEDGRIKPLRPATIRQYRTQLFRFAADLVGAGVPVAQITDIAALCRPQNAELGLRQMLLRSGNRTNRSISEMAALLRNLAASYCHVDEVDRKALARLAARVALKPQTGMTRKNRTRLLALQNPRTLRQFLLLPERLFAAAKPGRKPYYRALDRETAVAIAILLACPLRVGNLAEIHLERNIHRPGDGRAYLVFEEDETKNARRIEFELPPELCRMIDRHLASRCPELCPHGTAWLFPRRDGAAAVDPSVLSERISKTIRRSTGLDVNAHLFRHLAVMIWLDANPGSYEAARRLLGHAELSHTLNLYSGFEASSAARAFSDLVAAKKAGP
jgi:integrase